MKAITLWQPWATLVAIPKKRWETRSWSTKYRGRLAIHAAKRKVEKDLHSILYTDWEGNKIEVFPLGCVVATCDLVDVVPITPQFVKRYISMVEYLMGNFTITLGERFAWRLENVKKLETPVPAIGRQRLWNWDERYSIT